MSSTNPSLQLDLPGTSTDAPLIPVLCDTSNACILNADSGQLTNATASPPAAYQNWRQIVVSLPRSAESEDPFEAADPIAVFRPVLTLPATGNIATPRSSRVIPQVMCSITYPANCNVDASTAKQVLYSSIRDGLAAANSRDGASVEIKTDADVVRELRRVGKLARAIGQAFTISASSATGIPLECHDNADVSADTAGDDSERLFFEEQGLYQRNLPIGQGQRYTPLGYTLSSFSNPVGLIDSDDKLRYTASLNVTTAGDHAFHIHIDTEPKCGASRLCDTRLIILLAMESRAVAQELNTRLQTFQAVSREDQQWADGASGASDGEVAFGEGPPLGIHNGRALQVYNALMSHLANRLQSEVDEALSKYEVEETYGVARVALPPLNLNHLSVAQREKALEEGEQPYDLVTNVLVR